MAAEDGFQQEAIRQGEERVSCSEHGMRMMDCFELHHLPTIEEPPLPEPLRIVLPCCHLVLRPEGKSAIIECGCGKKWQVQLEAAGKAWDAREIRSG